MKRWATASLNINYCFRCRLTPDGVFNFQASLRHLSARDNDPNGLKSAAIVKSICLRNHPFMLENHTTDYSGFKLDSCYPSDVLKDCGGGNVGGRPLHVSGDGNCPFNPVSVLLSGTHGDCVELVLNDKFYKRAQPPSMLRSCTWGRLPSMRSAHISREGKWVRVRSMHAVASVTMETDKACFPVYDATPQYCFLPKSKTASLPIT